MKKKLLSLTLALVLCLGLPLAAYAAEVEDFVIENGVLVEYNGEGGDVAVPEGVAEIGARAFRGCTGLTSITLPSGTVRIGEYAFWDCTGLTAISLPSSVADIGKYAFTGCASLTDISIPSGVAHIAEGVFYGCTSLAHVDIPSSVTSIGSSAFSTCTSLSSIRIPSGVASIEGSAFHGCTGLTDINIPSGITSIEDGTFYGCTNLSGISIPSGVTRIGNWAFRYCASLTSVSIPSGVAAIELGAFEGCTSLTSIEIPASVTSIFGVAFSGCTALTDVYYGGTQAQWNEIANLDWHDELLSADVHYGSAASAATPTASTVLVNGKQVAFDAYTINGANYFKLRDLAFVLNGTEKQFSVGWDNASRTIALTSGGSYAAVGGELASGAAGAQTAKPSAARLLVDGREVSLTAYDIGGSNYFKLRDIGEVFDFGIGWDNASKTITIDTSVGYTAE